MSKLVAVDPGDSTGWAEYDIEAKMPSRFGIVKGEEEIWDWLDNESPDLWVVENFRVRPPKKAGWVPANQWGEVFTIRVIGAIRFHARRSKVSVVMQEPNIKRVAEGWSGIKEKDGAHEIDALLHGYYFLHHPDKRGERWEQLRNS